MTTEREKVTLVDGSPVTEDHRTIDAHTGMQKAYIVLSSEERAKGFVRPVRRSYVHAGRMQQLEDDAGKSSHQVRVGGCGVVTTMALAIAETYARNPMFYTGTYCTGCRTHKPLEEFVWDGTSEQVGS
jgi:hypothetical protein